MNNIEKSKHNQIDEEKSKISSLIEEIYEQLICMRQDDTQLTEQLISIYHGLCHLRQSFTNPQTNSTTDVTGITIRIDSPSPPPTGFHSKQRSDSEPNILKDRQRIIAIIDDLQ